MSPAQGGSMLRAIVTVRGDMDQYGRPPRAAYHAGSMAKNPVGGYNNPGRAFSGSCYAVSTQSIVGISRMNRLVVIFILWSSPSPAFAFPRQPSYSGWIKRLAKGVSATPRDAVFIQNWIKKP